MRRESTGERRGILDCRRMEDKAISETLLRLEQVTFFQGAFLTALETYLISIHPEGRDAGISTIHDFKKKVYDLMLREEEDKRPGRAAQLDIRPFLPKDKQDEWYLPFEAP